MKKILFMFWLVMFNAFSAEDSLYDFSWLDQDKKIYVLQNRKFRKNSKFYLGATGIKTISGSFIDSYGSSLKAGYFFKENWGLELVYGQNNGKTNKTFDAIDEQAAVAYYRKISNYAGAMLMWSPFYAKINTFDKIFYYDWIFGLGMGNFKTQDNRKEFGTNSSEELTSENNSGYIWTTGFRFYISESWSLRLDITGMHYQALQSRQDDSNDDYTKKSWFHTYDLGIGLNYTF
jgi:outer membrane beta-barrel protein